MAAEKTRADSLHCYLTGAGSDGGVQASPDLSLGNYRSSTRAGTLGWLASGVPANLTVVFVAGLNGPGAGTLTFSNSNDVSWAAPGEAAGPTVTILSGETKLLESATASKCITVTRTDATALANGTGSLTLTYVLNNVFGLSNLSSAQALAGVTRHRAVIYRNESSSAIASFKVWLATLGTQRSPDTTQLGASGAGTVTSSGGSGSAFADWPASGYVHAKSSAGTLKEIFYYSSRTNTTLTVPATGRGLGGTAATAMAASDLLDSIPGIRLAKEVIASGKIQGPLTSETTAPTSRTWVTGITAATGVDMGSLDAIGGAADKVGLWIEEFNPPSTQSLADVLHLIRGSFDAV